MPNSRKLQRRKNFDQVVHWVSDEFEQSDKVCMTPLPKEKYVEVYGSSAKNWEKLSTRTRTTESRSEIYYGNLCWETKKTLQASNMVLGEKSMMLEWFSLFFKTTYDSLLLLIAFDYFVKNVA